MCLLKSSVFIGREVCSNGFTYCTNKVESVEVERLWGDPYLMWRWCVSRRSPINARLKPSVNTDILPKRCSICIHVYALVLKCVWCVKTRWWPVESWIFLFSCRLKWGGNVSHLSGSQWVCSDRLIQFFFVMHSLLHGSRTFLVFSDTWCKLV